MNTVKKEMLKKIPAAFLWVFILLPLAGGLAFAFAEEAFAEQALCVFVSEKDNAWVVRKDSAVKSSLNVGDPIYKGDTLFVTQGNTVQLAFDKEAQNVIQVEGNTSVQFKESSPPRLDLNSGKLYALLDKKGLESKFKIYTPTAVAAVRGTHYSVSFASQTQRTDVATFSGSVKVAGLDSAGVETSKYVIVDAGKKTSVIDLGQIPADPTAMSVDEMRTLDPVLAHVEEARDFMKKLDGKALDPDSKDAISKQSKMVKTEVEEKEEAKGNTIIL